MSLFDQDCGTSPGTRKESDQIQSDWVFGSTQIRHGSGSSIPKSTYRDDHDLDFISTSTEALNRQFDAFKKKMIEEMRGLYRHQKSDLREMNESIINPLLSEVRDMRGVLEMLSNGTKGSSSGKSGSKTSLTAWENKLIQLTPKADVIFNKEIFARILCFNGPLKVCEVYNTAKRSVGSRVSTAAKVLLFSHQPSATKEEYSDGAGKLHSDFKYAVVQNTFYNVCRNTFDLFRSTLGAETAAGTAGRRNEHCRINRPSWLQPGYVTVDHINAAQNFVESVNQSRKAKVRDTPSADDIASHGALRVYRQLGSHLHRGRDYMKTSFFDSLGYVFVPWKDYVSDNDQRKMVLSFSNEENDVGATLCLDDIPCTDLCSFASDVERSNQVNASNRDMLKRLFSEWPGLVLCVEHDVHVTRGKRHSGERRELRRLINLIEVASNVLVEYTRVGNIDLFLRGHKYALRCIMVFAFFIKGLTVEFINMRNALEPDPDDPERTVPNVEHVIVHDSSLKGLLPGKSLQENHLGSKCLRISEKMYDTWHVVDEDGDGDCETGSGEAFVVSEITESDELGVAPI